MTATMSDDEIETIVESGERLPSDMWESGLPETIMTSPVYDGEKIVEQAKG